ncbi:glycosyl hydrolase family 28-related protein [Paenibacillus aquistagni]|uniref:glycosyl hydrolase family 28-related protein n=1 Tax=Paenibacillus aquistagni TaxID=1852522 RepID=UPI000B4FDE04|nr:glycosyl hydrolase family 28-related protein [Paenibacillus aquistagni]
MKERVHQAAISEPDTWTAADLPIWAKQISRKHLIAAMRAAEPDLLPVEKGTEESAEPVWTIALTDDSPLFYKRNSARSVTDYGAKGDGVHNDEPAIMKAILQEDTIYFPNGQYGIGSTLLLRGLNQKKFVFHPEAKLVHLRMAEGSLLQIHHCKALTFYNLSVHAFCRNAPNAILVMRSDHVDFLGITQITCSSARSFVVGGASHTITIETLIMNHSTAAEGLALLNCNNITVGTLVRTGG